MPSTQLKLWVLRNISSINSTKLRAAIRYLLLGVTTPVCSCTTKYPRLIKNTRAKPKKKAAYKMLSTGLVVNIKATMAAKLASDNIPDNRSLCWSILSNNCIRKIDLGGKCAAKKLLLSAYRHWPCD